MNAPQNAAETVADESFVFVQDLARELSSGTIDLPAFPDIVARVRQVLADEFVSSKQIVRVVSSEPALAARLLTIANSAAMNPGGQRITELRSAIARIGLNMVRSASVAFAMEQMRRADDLAPMRPQMNQLWERSVLVAALCFVLARRTPHVNPDTALLAGLMHGLGKLYILTRSQKYPSLFADQPTYAQVVRDWHAQIARAILENWQMTDDVVAAIGDYEDTERDYKGAPDLTDVLTVANLLATYHEYPETLELNLQGVKSCARLQLNGEACERIVRESAREIASLRAALGT